MVFQDLSQRQYPQESRTQAIAPASDRLLAVFFDIVLFSPLFSLLLSRMFRQIEFRSYTSPGSTELTILVLISVVLIAVLTIITQAMCLYFFQATPGKYFFKLRVISLHGTSERLSWSQAFLRSGLWAIEFLMFMVPFAEVLSHSLRRPIHDRAADTMVITLKKQTDQGPHPLEIQFVRNFLMMLVMSSIFLGSLFVGHFYNLALKGEFKRKELESDQYLCRSVSIYVKSDQNRVDHALARYIAGEVDEECVLSEADFALWTDHSQLRAWGYFAKGFHYRLEKDKATLYFQKVCETDSKSEACFMAKALTKKEMQISSTSLKSLTARVLEIKELALRGNHELTLKKLSELSEGYNGFERFSQIETAKNLWVLSRPEEAKGAYRNTWSHMMAQDKSDFASWMCLEQLDDKCGNQNYFACDDLRKHLKENRFDTLSAEAVVAVLKERNCKKSSEFNPLALIAQVDENKALRDYILATSYDSQWSPAQRLQALRELAFSGNTSASRFLQRRSILALLESTQDEQDFTKALGYLKKQEMSEWMVKKMTAALLSRASILNLKKISAQAALLLEEKVAERFNIGKLRKTAIKDSEVLLREERIPASEGP